MGAHAVDRPLGGVDLGRTPKQPAKLPADVFGLPERARREKRGSRLTHDEFGRINRKADKVLKKD